MAAYLRTLQRFAGEEESLKIGELLDAVCHRRRAFDLSLVNADLFQGG